MKKLSNLLAALVFVSLVIFISCTSDPGATPDPLADQAALLLGGWTVNASQIGYNGGTSPDGDWSNFSLTISNATADGGSYATSGVPDGFSNVWASGSWSFNNDDIDEVLRTPDNIVMDVSSVTETSLTLEFTVVNDGGRTAGIAGDWSFTFTAQ